MVKRKTQRPQKPSSVSSCGFDSRSGLCRQGRGDGRAQLVVTQSPSGIGGSTPSPCTPSSLWSNGYEWRLRSSMAERRSNEPVRGGSTHPQSRMSVRRHGLLPLQLDSRARVVPDLDIRCTTSTTSRCEAAVTSGSWRFDPAPSTKPWTETAADLDLGSPYRNPTHQRPEGGICHVEVQPNHAPVHRRQRGPLRGAGAHVRGRPARLREPKGELFLLAVTNMVGEDTFYEAAGDRDAGSATLVAAVAVDDPDWVARFLAWLRAGANLRSASLVAAAEGVARTVWPPAAGRTGRSWRRRCSGRTSRARRWRTGRRATAGPFPSRSSAESPTRSARLYTERRCSSTTPTRRRFRFGDVVELVHPTPPTRGRATCSGTRSDRRHGRENPLPASLRDAGARDALQALPRSSGARCASPTRRGARARRHDLGVAGRLAGGRAGRRRRGRRSSRRWATWRCCGTCATSTRPAWPTTSPDRWRRGWPTRARWRVRGSCRCGSSRRTGRRRRCGGRGRWSRRCSTRWRMCRRCRVARWSWWTRSGSMFGPLSQGRARCSRCGCGGGVRRGARASAPRRPTWCSSVRRHARYVPPRGGSVLSALRGFGRTSGGTNTARAVREHYRRPRPGGHPHRRAGLGRLAR